MKIGYIFEPDEIRPSINLVGETFMLGSSPTKTFRGKRLYSEIIDGQYDDIASDMIGRCKRWYKSGLKHKVTLTKLEVIVFHKLVEYCKRLQSF